jgi:putative flippase GtrA
MAADAWYRHLGSGALFVLVGLVQLAFDSSLFVALTAAGVPVVAGNLIGRVGGATLGFWLNGRYTFGRPRLDRGHALRFAAVWIPLTFLSTALVGFVASRLGLHGAWMAKPIVEAGLAVISYFLWKHVVYR